MVIALFGADLIYFELNPNGQLLEVDKKEGLADINCLAIAPVRHLFRLFTCVVRWAARSVLTLCAMKSTLQACQVWCMPALCMRTSCDVSVHVVNEFNVAITACSTRSAVQVPEGRERSSVVVAGCADNTVRVLSLRQADCLKVKATQATASAPSSVMLMEASISAAGASCSDCTCDLHVSVAATALLQW